MAAKIISISLTPELNKEVASIAQEERRTISEVFREALRQYAANRVVSKIRKKIRKSKVTPDELEELIDRERR